MAICKAQCPVCQGIIDTDSEKDAVICPLCATPFIVAKGVELYANSTHGQSLELGIKNGNSFLQLKEWRRAYDVFMDLSNKYPHDARVWLGIARAISHEQNCHSITMPMLNAIKSNVEKVRTLSLGLADNSWDVYIENEEDRLQREAQNKEMMRRKLQNEYDETVKRAARQLGTMVANKKSMRTTYTTLGLIILIVGGALTGCYFGALLLNLWYLYIGAAAAGVGLLVTILGLCCNPKKVRLPGSDVEDMQRTVERITQSAKRSGVEVDMSVPIRTQIQPRK